MKFQIKTMKNQMAPGLRTTVKRPGKRNRLTKERQRLLVMEAGLAGELRRFEQLKEDLAGREGAERVFEVQQSVLDEHEAEVAAQRLRVDRMSRGNPRRWSYTKKRAVRR